MPDTAHPELDVTDIWRHGCDAVQRTKISEPLKRIGRISGAIDAQYERTAKEKDLAPMPPQTSRARALILPLTQL
jgi:hypothetical protein